MSSVDFLDQLLDGAEVEWKPLGDVLVRTKGTKITAGQMKGLHKEDGTVKIFAGGRTVAFVNPEDIPAKDINRKPSIIVKSRGVIEFEYYDKPFSHKNEMWSYHSNSDHIHIKFFYHFLKLNEPHFQQLGSKMQMPQIATPDTDKFLVPIPCPENPKKSLDIQAEIVRILDAFTSLTAELTAELTMREKQYHYYRDNLLTFSDDVEWKTLAELGTLIRGNGMQKKDFTETGFPAIHYGQIYTHFGTFANTTKSYVSDELAKKLRKAHKGDVLLAGTSENIQDVMKPLGWLGDEVAISGDMFAYRPNNDLDTKYLTYLLQTTEFQKYKEKYAQGAKVTRLNTEKFLNFNVPVPSLKEQKRIANILDKFEVLTISLTEGLPREIALRQQQYEYYREQLLDFPQ